MIIFFFSQNEKLNILTYQRQIFVSSSSVKSQFPRSIFSHQWIVQRKENPCIEGKEN